MKNNLLAILACLLWASAIVTAKKALNYQPPLTLAGQRFLLAGLLLLPLCKGIKKPFELLVREFKTVFLVSLFHTIYLYATFFYCMQLVRGAEAAIVIGMGPLASALVAHFSMKNDPLNRKTIISVALGISGVTLISIASKPWSPVGMKEFLGIMLLLTGSFVSATGNVIVAKRKEELPPIALCCSQMLFGGFVLLVLGRCIHGPILPPEGAVYYPLLLWLAIISAAGFSIWFYLLSKIKVSKLNIWKFIIPLFGAILSWLLLPNESPTLSSLVGMLLITIAIIFRQAPSFFTHKKS